MKYKAILFDADGVVLKEGQRFSEYYSEKYGVPLETMNPFFSGPFQRCLIGQADLKEELAKVLDEWRWRGTVDELLEVWFSTSNELNEEAAVLVKEARSKNIACYLATNQEKHRGDYFKNRLQDMFDGFFVSSDIGHKKDEIEFYQCIFNHLKGPIAAGDVLLIDDDIKNVRTALTVGINSIHYHHISDLADIIHDQAIN